MSNTDTFIFFGILILFVIVILFLLVKKINKNKTIATSILPTRMLNKDDLKAIQYIDLDAKLSVDLLLSPKLPKGKLLTSVWKFDNIDFIISTTYRYKRIVHHFALIINNQVIEVVVPEVFLPYLYEGQPYNNKTIEILYRKEFFVLYSIDGLIGYPELYKKLKLSGGYNGDYISKRPSTKKDQEAFLVSKWTSVWGMLAPILFPMSILAIMHEGLGMSVVFLPFILFVAIPLRIAYKKRKKHIKSRAVYRIKGKITFDNDRYLFRVNATELKLHNKWKKEFKKTTMPIDDVTMEVMLHTFDELDQTTRLRLQPISIQSAKITINETTHKSTRSWMLPFYFAVASGFVAYLAPLQKYVIVDLRNLTSQTKDVIFKLVMTAAWWISIVLTIYLSYLVIKRIQGHYFTSKNNL